MRTVCAQWIYLIRDSAERELHRLSCSPCFFLVCQSVCKLVAVFIGLGQSFGIATGIKSCDQKL